MNTLCGHGCGSAAVYFPPKGKPCCSQRHYDCPGYLLKLKQNAFVWLPDKNPVKRAEIKQQISKAMVGNKNGNGRGDRQSYYHSIRMDSKWEVGVAMYFDSQKWKWKYTPKTFALSDGRTYTPDFELIKDQSLFIEVKGWFRPSNKIKFDLFKTDYPKIQIEVWDRVKLQNLKILDSSGYLLGCYTAMDAAPAVTRMS